MTYEQIEKVLQKSEPTEPTVKISFKTRSSINGIMIRTSDFQELSKKNLWRIVNEIHVANFKQSRDESLARIFNGQEFTKLELLG